MIRHVVMFKFKEEAEGRTKAENLAIAKEMLEALPAKIDLIRASAVSINSTNADPSNYDLCLIADFDSFEDLAAYIVHPDHKAVGAFMRPVRLSRACVDFEI
ncbi:MAG: Dabb family protein [Clostridia bacterium]|nr:Dabb family protein [Clostridia bacterium]